MRKFALLFAFVLVMALTGSAFAASSVTFGSINELDLGEPDFTNKFTPFASTPNETDNSVVITITADGGKATPNHFQKIRDAVAGKLSGGDGSGRYEITIDIADQDEIPPGAFDGDKFLKQITLKSTAYKLKKIGANAFANTPSLIAVAGSPNFPDNNGAFFTEIGERAFYNSGLSAAISFANVKNIGKEAFAASTHLGEAAAVTWGNTLETIGEGAFRNTSLAYADTGESKAGLFFTSGALSKLESIGKEAFMGTKLYVIDFGGVVALETIGEGAFKNVILNTSLDISVLSFPATLESIGKDAFMGLKGTDSSKKIQLIDLSPVTSVTEIPEGMFRESRVVQEVKVHNQLKTIGAYAFYDSKVEAVRDGVGSSMGFAATKLEKIGDYAFAQSALKSDVADASNLPNSGNDFLSFPATLTEIGNHAFAQAHSVVSMYFYADETDYDPKTPAEFNTTGFPKLGLNAFANMDQGTSYWFNINNTPKELSNTVFGLPYTDNAGAPETVALVSKLAAAGLPTRKIEQLTGLSFSVVKDIVNSSSVAPQLPPTISGAPEGNLLSGTVDVTFTYDKLTASGLGITWSLEKGQELEWLKIDPSSGVLSGKPTAPVTSEFTVRAKNNVDSDSVKLKIVVSSGTGQGGGSGSTGGSGGCAAGFAPIAALFVLGALKLRKGR